MGISFIVRKEDTITSVNRIMLILLNKSDQKKQTDQYHKICEDLYENPEEPGVVMQHPFVG